MITSFLLVTIALAVAVGCYVGQKHFVDLDKAKQKFSRDYFVGLNFLLNEQPDKAVDVFTKLLQVDSETVETHLALGNLFRRRGEVDRAIRIHQNLIAKPQLEKEQRVDALIALGNDYLHAGLIDRAERLFLEITAMGEQPIISLRYLLDIYQQQKKWQEAISVATQLKQITNDPLHIRIGHYHCELAQTLLQKHDVNAAYQELKLALKVDNNCARANLMLGNIEYQLGHYQPAIQAYQQILEQDHDYFVECLPFLINCYLALDDERNLVKYLQECLKKLPQISIVLWLTDYKRKSENDQIAAEFLTEYLRKQSSLKGLQYLINLQLENATANTNKDDILILQDLIQILLKDAANYRCIQCGFKSKQLLWLCPSCKTWSSIKPILDA